MAPLRDWVKHANQVVCEKETALSEMTVRTVPHLATVPTTVCDAYWRTIVHDVCREPCQRET